jgi:hypothetical protein
MPWLRALYERSEQIAAAGDRAAMRAAFYPQTDDDRARGVVRLRRPPPFTMKEKTMPEETYIDRMHIEHDQLSERINKLDEFVGGDAFNALPQMQQELLRIQLSAMRTYQRALGTRLELAAQPVPMTEQERERLVEQDDGSAAFVRDKPVMDTSAFRSDDEVDIRQGVAEK